MLVRCLGTFDCGVCLIVVGFPYDVCVCRILLLMCFGCCLDGCLMFV